MTSDDLLMESVPMDRLSSCSLDSVIGYLDELLGRKDETVDETAMRSPFPMLCDVKDETIGRVKLSSDRVRSNFADEECAQRVMDLSFASVYEMPSSSNVGHSMVMPVRSVIGCQKVMTVLSESHDAPESLDSGVESNKSDDECQTNGGHSPVACCASLGDKGRNYAIPLHQHDYQNLISCSPLQQQQQRRPARRNHSTASSNCRTGRTNRNRQDGPIGNVHDQKPMKDDKFYEICLGHLCLQMEAGNSQAGTGLGFDRWISIFSLQKHQDELIQLSGSPSSPSASSPANHRKHSHHHQPQSHQPGGKRQSQRHHSTGGISSRQGSQENNNSNNGRSSSTSGGLSIPSREPSLADANINSTKSPSPQRQERNASVVSATAVDGGATTASGNGRSNPSPPSNAQQTTAPAGQPTGQTGPNSNQIAQLTLSPSERAMMMGKVLKTLILASSSASPASALIRDRKVPGRGTVRHCLVGTEMVDWLLGLSPEVHSRAQASAMWQVLLDEQVILALSKEHQFKDKFVFYRFHDDAEGRGDGPAGRKPNADVVRDAQQKKDEVISTLTQLAPDAVLKAILRKPTHDRSPDDLEIIYEELVHIRALSHLSTTVKRELANIIVFESHPRAETVLFNQGDEGTSWYVILKGSVNVVIHGKGVVTTLQDGDDFGQLALINNAPRAATIITREDGCQFLRVDKDDFNRILRDVEANTVRLKEHGRDVLVLEKVSANPSAAHRHSASSHYKYTVMAGMPQKMLEHLLETRLDARHLSARDEDIIRPYSSATDMFLDDFLLTHIMFMPTHQLITELMRKYRIESPTQDKEFVVASKSRVVNFVYQWVTSIRDPVFDETITHSFFEQLHSEVHADARLYHTLREEAAMLDHVQELLGEYRAARQQGGSLATLTWTLPAGGQSVVLFSAVNAAATAAAAASNRKNSGESSAASAFSLEKRRPIRADDDIIFRVYCADHTYCTLRQPVNATAETIKLNAADKLGLRHEELVLAEIKSNGEKSVISDTEVSIATCLSINGRIFVSPKDHLDAMTVLPDQEGPSDGTCNELEMFSTRELAYYITLIDWDLFCSVHEYELLYHVAGAQPFRKIKSNLDLFLRRFNEIQYWVVTEICLANTLGKRVQLLRKFIKLAAYCKEFQNLNAFFALVMGLSNVAVSRLTQTWERLPSKLRKMFNEFDGLIEPSRNHRAYRIAVGKLQPPILPFMPLLLKDMTFTHEGNRTLLDSAGLINFEKMHMLAQTMRTLRYCRMLQPPTPRSEQEVRNYIRNLRVVDNQRILTGLSQRLEPKRA
ncbi:rap guanine nucleotide exchange factor 4-like isoform X2 [Daphnia carinata]|uniref:rap guanine nucleotide exchange factor 4-like isoform X2 n=1 Tax=Daphnia carinata TaxID=120202 RepID=UPI0028684C09|nr:rap guanine nucleotide exchange factor 4-like isoform X2 [Daphnia carinata]